MSTHTNRELVLHVLQFLNEEKLCKTARMLEQESGCYFNMKYFEEQVLAGKLDDADSYLQGFMRIADYNFNSMIILFLIRKQRYFEALDRKDLSKAVEILVKDLKLFKNFNKDFYDELTSLITLENIREHKRFSGYVDATCARKKMLQEIGKLIRTNPQLSKKLEFPNVQSFGLRNLINATGQLVNPNPPILHYAVAAGEIISYTPENPVFLIWPKMVLASNARINSQPVSSDQARRWLHIAPADEVAYIRPTHPHDMYSQDYFPITVARSLNQGSKVISMDFHPEHHIVLLVGTSTGDIGIWDVGSGKELFRETFIVWGASDHSTNMQGTLLVDEPAVSVNRCIWSSNGKWVGIAFSKCIIHTYSSTCTVQLMPHLQINAHIGSVNDIAFNSHNEQSFVITCGDDRSIKVWDIKTGRMQLVFEEHEAPVYCIFPYQRNDLQIILSTATDGKIKAWSYECKKSLSGYDAPQKSCATIAYSADGSRLFLCGTSEGGESYLVELNESNGEIKRTYAGLQQQSIGVVQFDTSNRLLAAGHDNQIKIWDMDNVDTLISTYVEEGCLEASPRLCLNKEGSLLAVSTKDNGIKILSNAPRLYLHDH